MSESRVYDLIIIGSGACGGTLAYALASSGKQILILERGDFLPKERENWDTHAVFVEKRYQTDEIWYQNGQPFHPSIHYWVGGNTKLFGAALFRLRESDFEEILHADGISLVWPSSYNDVAPYYTISEHLYHVRGKRGQDSTEPPTDADYRFGPVPHEPRIQQLETDLKKYGLHPFSIPLGVKLGDDKPYPQAPTILSYFDGYPDPTDSKADAHVIAVKKALNHDNVTLITNCFAEKLITDTSGRTVKEVRVQRNGQTETYRSNLVVVACGAANSAALMLRSVSGKHPAGLANSSDLVGRNYMCHNNATFLAISKEPNESIFQKTLAFSDWYLPGGDREYPMGLVQMLGKVDKELMTFEAPEPLDGMSYEEMALHSLDFWLQSEDLPEPDNRVTINSEGQILFQYKRNNLETHHRLTEKLKSILGHIGCHEHFIPVDYYLGTELPFNLAHQCGTMRFGNDPNSSVLDLHCKTHDVDNLYVLDGSFFVSAGAVNPSLTIMANALRVADHLVDEIM
jgi:choline dehydrogenase-like flavoprotein